MIATAPHPSPRQRDAALELLRTAGDLAADGVPEATAAAELVVKAPDRCVLQEAQLDLPDGLHRLLHLFGRTIVSNPVEACQKYRGYRSRCALRPLERLVHLIAARVIGNLRQEIVRAAVRNPEDVQLGDDHAKPEKGGKQQRIHHGAAILEYLYQAVRVIQRILLAGGFGTIKPGGPARVGQMAGTSLSVERPQFRRWNPACQQAAK